MLLILGTLVMMSLIPTSYLNEEMMWQIKRLTRIRETYNHIVRDDQLIRANPASVQNRIQRIGLTMLRDATKDLEGVNKIEKMEELAGEVYDLLTEAIDEVEKDVTYNP